MNTVPDYRQALVTYVDVLGFKEMVTASQQSSQVANIGRLLAVLRNQLQQGCNRAEFEHSTPVPLSRPFSFSDLTVRATFIDNEHNFQNILLGEIMFLADRQLELACWGADEWEEFPIVLRGAISVGRLSMNPQRNSEEIIFGPALIRSYELEKDTAVYPRIVIDREVLTVANKHKEFQCGSLVRRGDDGIHFIDYLRRCSDFDQTEYASFNNSSTTLAKHKEMIQKKVKALTPSPKGSRKPSDRIIQKYLWLASYHNLTVDLLPEPGETENPIPGYDDNVLNGVNKKELYVSDDLFNF